MSQPRQPGQPAKHQHHRGGDSPSDGGGAGYGDAHPVLGQAKSSDARRTVLAGASSAISSAFDGTYQF